MREKLKAILAVVGVLIVMGIVASILPSYLDKRSTKSTGNDFVHALLADDVDKSYGLIAKKTQSDTTKEQWQSQVVQLSSFFQNKSPQLISTQVTKPSTTLIYSIDGSDGVYHFTVVLDKETGGWRVLTFSSVRQQQ